MPAQHRAMPAHRRYRVPAPDRAMPVARALDDRPMATDPAPASVPRYSAYSLPSARLPGEDILFYVDVDLKVRAEMKSATAASSGSTSTALPQPAWAGGAPAVGTRTVVRRMDTVRQALLLFVHSKLAMCPDHRFAFGSLGETFSMVNKGFSSDAGLAMEAIHSLSASESSYPMADLTQLFMTATQEGKRAESQGQILRVATLNSQETPLHLKGVKTAAGVKVIDFGSACMEDPLLQVSRSTWLSVSFLTSDIKRHRAGRRAVVVAAAPARAPVASGVSGLGARAIRGDGVHPPRFFLSLSFASSSVASVPSSPKSTPPLPSRPGWSCHPVPAPAPRSHHPRPAPPTLH